MAKKEYVTFGSCKTGVPGAKHDFTGARFTLSPMSDDYVNIILGALDKLDTSNVWSKTDKLSTIYRGRRADVVDAVEACFVYAYRPDVHMNLEVTFNKGCPGDCDSDFVLSDAEVPANREAIKDIHFPVDCKFALYPMGVEEYMGPIADVVNRAVDLELFVETAYYATVLKGDVHQIFDYFDWVNETCAEAFSHYVIEASLTVNSPTAD